MTMRAMATKVALLLLTMWTATPPLKAQVRPDSLCVKVYFPCGGDRLSAVPSNWQDLQQFVLRLDSLAACRRGETWRLGVTASTSPEGSLAVNRRLARARAKAVSDYLVRNAACLNDPTSKTGWLVEELTSNHLAALTPRRAFATMRFAEVSLWREPQLVWADTRADVPVKMTVENELMRPETDSVRPVGWPETRVVRPLIFVKTNLIYDLLTAVNVSVEMPIRRQWSLGATLIYPWWRKTKWHKTMQLRYVALSSRCYWLGSTTTDRSAFVGLTAGGGKYDFQPTRRGVQGDVWHVSATVGGVRRLSRGWRLEYAASAGYVQTDYTKYTQTSGTPYGTIKVKDYPWGSRRLRTILPTSVELSIVYEIDTKTKGGRHER